MLERIKFPKKDDEMVTVLPNANIYEQDNNIVLALEMPGVDKDTLDVTIDSNNLMIKGKKKKDVIPKGYDALYQERHFVRYKRTFELNVDVDRDKLKAEYKNGILKVSLPKSEKSQPKKIEIQT